MRVIKVRDTSAPSDASDYPRRDSSGGSDCSAGTYPQWAEPGLLDVRTTR